MKKGFSSISHLIANDTLITDKQQVADLLTSNTFKKSRSEKKYSESFQKAKETKEKKRLNFSTENTEDYDLPFSRTELKLSRQKSNDAATGLDRVHYQFLTH